MSAIQDQNIKQQVGDLIREVRKAKGLTQKELGQKLGVGVDRISKYESGKTNPTLNTVQEIFDALNTSVKVIIDQ